MVVLFGFLALGVVLGFIGRVVCERRRTARSNANAQTERSAQDNTHMPAREQRAETHANFERTNSENINPSNNYRTGSRESESTYETPSCLYDYIQPDNL